MGLGTIGFMIGTGGSAIVSKTMGEGKEELANQYFSMLVWVALGLGTVLSALVFHDKAKQAFISKMIR